MSRQDLGAFARNIVDSNVYMVLGTADADGHPWASPVYFAHKDYKEFYWMSLPDVTHSQNLAVRPELSIAIFNSQQPPGTGEGFYTSARAEILTGDDIERALEFYPGASDRGARPMSPEDFRPPNPWNLYRATASEHFVLCPKEPGRLCAEHGRPGDHRIAVTL